MKQNSSLAQKITTFSPFDPIRSMTKYLGVPERLYAFQKSYPELLTQLQIVQKSLEDLFSFKEDLEQKVDKLSKEKEELRVELEKSRKMNAQVRDEVEKMKSEMYPGAENTSRNKKMSPKKISFKKMIPRRTSKAAGTQ
eukprot:snap_masked-scaffold_5-processed-gene-20.37-mRNA-1 protein AED:1.00 eAED:1.00 QI:0/-1/0/0/-1/1/1/0/138